MQLLGVRRQRGLEPNVITYRAVICAGGLALQHFDEIRQQGLQPNVITYSALISACGKCDMPERALQLFD